MDSEKSESTIAALVNSLGDHDTMARDTVLLEVEGASKEIHRRLIRHATIYAGLWRYLSGSVPNDENKVLDQQWLVYAMRGIAQENSDLISVLTKLNEWFSKVAEAETEYWNELDEE